MTQHTPILEHFLWRDPSFKKLEVFRMSQVPGYFLPFILVWKGVNWQELGRDWTNREVRVPIELESLPSHICFFFPGYIHTESFKSPLLQAILLPLYSDRQGCRCPWPTNPTTSPVWKPLMLWNLEPLPFNSFCKFEDVKGVQAAATEYLRVMVVRGIYQPSWSVLMWSIRSQESPKALL